MNYSHVHHDKALNITQSMREQIYEDVWSEALYKVAPKYNVSAGTLKKRCLKYWDIPVPDTSYWARVHAGKVEIRPALPMPPAEFARYYISEYAVSFIDLEDLSEPELYEVDPLFVFSEKTRRLLEKTVNASSVPSEITDPPYDFKTIMNSVDLKEGSPHHRGILILYALSEMARSFEGGWYLEGANEKRHLFLGYFILCDQVWCYHMDYDTVTGKLILSIFWSRWSDCNKEKAAYNLVFSDKDNEPLEQQIGYIFRKIMIESAKKNIEEEIGRRAEIVRRANDERERKLEPYIVKEDEDAENALREANAFDNAQKIRAYAMNVN